MQANGWSLGEPYCTLEAPGANRLCDAVSWPQPGPLPPRVEREILTPPSAAPAA